MAPEAAAEIAPRSRFSGPIAFRVAAGFFLIAAGVGVYLRAYALWPSAKVNYGFVLHAHSHTAFLGWIYNAFFALAVQYFVADSDRPRYARLFWITQLATGGMLCVFPFEGYARESIIFSTLHMICSGVFAWKLLRKNTATPAARRYLARAFVCLFASALGPLTLGPLAAMGLRDSPWYTFSIYTYLHFQYNGWFMFFLLAVVIQRLNRPATPAFHAAAAQAHVLITAGVLTTLAVSALWMQPPPWVRGLAWSGALVQLAGFVYLGIHLRRAHVMASFSSHTRWVVGGVAIALGIKLLLQWLAAWPALGDLVNQRFSAIGFLHLIFLLVVSPFLFVLAIELGWMRWSVGTKIGLGAYAAGVVITEAVLAYVPLSGRLALPMMNNISEWFFAGSLVMAAGVALLVQRVWRG